MLQNRFNSTSWFNDVEWHFDLEEMFDLYEEKTDLLGQSELKRQDILSWLEDEGLWGFSDKRKGILHLWAKPSVTDEDLITLIAHELSNLFEPGRSPEGGMDADLLGDHIAQVTRKAFDIVNERPEAPKASCNYLIAWIGFCTEDPGPEGYCEEHAGLKCTNCGDQAAGQCSHTMGASICGEPLCNWCEHDPEKPRTLGTEGHKRVEDQKGIEESDEAEVIHS